MYDHKNQDQIYAEFKADLIKIYPPAEEMFGESLADAQGAVKPAPTASSSSDGANMMREYSVTGQVKASELERIGIEIKTQ
eukprot:4428239-Pyramimonas_sp.AAC.1